MARNFYIRRSMATYADNIDDGSKRLKLLVGSRHFIDKDSITELMNDLKGAFYSK